MQLGHKHSHHPIPDSGTVLPCLYCLLLLPMLAPSRLLHTALGNPSLLGPWLTQQTPQAEFHQRQAHDGGGHSTRLEGVVSSVDLSSAFAHPPVLI